jgi:uncharacterized protein YodC (DUF2158 family)
MSLTTEVKPPIALNPGDTVVLKSGGPDMTINWIEDDQACCSWFTCDVVVIEKFPLVCLRLR